MPESALFQPDDARLWSGGRVPVCWTSESTQRATFADESRVVRKRALASWPAVAKVDLSGWGTCAARRGDSVAIGLFSALGSQSTTGMGLGEMSLGVDRPDFASALVPHELGHVLGFGEEMEREDFPQDLERPCRAATVPGDSLGTPADRASIMASTGYCHNAADLTLWDALGAQSAYGRRLEGMAILVNAWSPARGYTAAATLDGLAEVQRQGDALAHAEGWLFSVPVPGTAPLKLFRHPERGDTLAAATRASEQAAESAGYELVRTEGYVYTSPQPGTVPLKLLRSAERGTHLTTASGGVDASRDGYAEVRTEGYVFVERPYRLLWAYRSADGDALTASEASSLVDVAEREGYQLERFDAAVLTHALPGTVAVKSFYSAARGDHLLAATPTSEAEATAAGYALVQDEGYVFSASVAGLTPLGLYRQAGAGDSLTTTTAPRTGYTSIRTEGYVLGLN